MRELSVTTDLYLLLEAPPLFTLGLLIIFIKVGRCDWRYAYGERRLIYLKLTKSIDSFKFKVVIGGQIEMSASGTALIFHSDLDTI